MQHGTKNANFLCQSRFSEMASDLVSPVLVLYVLL